MKNFTLSLQLAGIVLVCGFNAVCQTITSAQPGAWNNTLTWNGGVIPNASNSDVIFINHDITIPTGFSAIVDGTTISSGNTLTVSTGGVLNISSALADEVNVDGILVGSAGSSITGAN